MRIAISFIFFFFSFSCIACRGGTLDFKQIIDGADNVAVGFITGLLAKETENLNISSENPKAFKFSVPLTITYRVLITENLLGETKKIHELDAPCQFSADLLEQVIVIKKEGGTHIRPYDAEIHQVVKSMLLAQ